MEFIHNIMHLPYYKKKNVHKDCKTIKSNKKFRTTRKPNTYDTAEIIFEIFSFKSYKKSKQGILRI
jgi:hypothetical protein